MSPLFSQRTGAVIASVMAALLGALIAMASSLPSLGTSVRSRAGAPAPPVSTPAPTPSPEITVVGLLGASSRMQPVGGVLLASGQGGRFESSDEGQSWRPLVFPAGAAGIALDPANGSRRLTGGPSLLLSTDRGASWKLVRPQPPGQGPYNPLLISPDEPDVWFVTAHGRLIRTRDSGVSWRELPGVAVGDSIQMARGPSPKEWVVITGGKYYLLVDNGTQITEGIAPPGGSVVQLALVGDAEPARLLALGADGMTYRLQGSWAQTGPFSGPVDGVSNGLAWIAAGGSALGKPAQLAYSSDGGQTWAKAIGLPSDQTAEAVVALSPDGRSVLVYLYGGDLFRSADGGATWALFSHALRAPSGA